MKLICYECHEYYEGTASRRTSPCCGAEGVDMEEVVGGYEDCDCWGDEDYPCSHDLEVAVENGVLG